MRNKSQVCRQGFRQIFANIHRLPEDATCEPRCVSRVDLQDAREEVDPSREFSKDRDLVGRFTVSVDQCVCQGINIQSAILVAARQP